MPDEESGGVEQKWLENCSEPCINHTCKDDSSSLSEGQKAGADGHLHTRHVLGSASSPAITIVISQPEEIPDRKAVISRNVTSDGDDNFGMAATCSSKKDFLSRSESYQEQCRICQQETDEPLIDLGCRCRGELANAHQSCIEIWFRARGSNKCEICLQTAVNVPFPESQPSTNYWVWRVDPADGVLPEHERGCLSPLWLAFSILIGGLLLDIVISVSLGVSALPVNVIIGVLIILGLGTALRLTVECCNQLGARRNLQIAETTANPGYHPAERTWGTWFQML